MRREGGAGMKREAGREGEVEGAWVCCASACSASSRAPDCFEVQSSGIQALGGETTLSVRVPRLAPRNQKRSLVSRITCFSPRAARGCTSGGKRRERGREGGREEGLSLPLSRPDSTAGLPCCGWGSTRLSELSVHISGYIFLACSRTLSLSGSLSHTLFRASATCL